MRTLLFALSPFVVIGVAVWLCGRLRRMDEQAQRLAAAMEIESKLRQIETELRRKDTLRRFGPSIRAAQTRLRGNVGVDKEDA